MRNSSILKYSFSGVLLGLCFPLFALILDGFFFKHLAFGWDMIVKLHKENPIHFIIDSVPFVLGGAFGAIGYYAKRVTNKILEKNNQELKAYQEESTQNAAILKNTNEYLSLTQRDLDSYILRVSEAKKMAKLAVYEFYPQKNRITHTYHLNDLLEIDKKLKITTDLLETYIHRQDYANVIENQQKTIQSKINTFYRFRLKTEGYQDWHWFQGATHCVLDNENEVEYIINSLQDITQTVNKENEIEKLLREVNIQNQELQASEEELKENAARINLQKDDLEQSQKQLESLSNNLQGIMYRCLADEDWTMKFISKGVERITGYAASDFIDNKIRSFGSIIYQEDNFIIDSEVNQAIQTNEPYKIEYRIIHENGSLIWVEESGQVVEDKIHNLNYLDGVLMDITERKQAETIIETQTQKLLTYQKELEQQQKILSDAEKMAKMGSYVWNLITREIKYSENLPPIFRLEKNVVIDQIIFDTIIHPQDREEHQRAINEAMTTGKKELFTTYRAKPAQVSENDWKSYYTYSIIEYDKNSEPIMLTATVQDVTEQVAQQKMAEELLNYVKENKENLEQSQRSAQIVSYETNLITKKIQWSDSFDEVFEVENYQIPQDTSVFQEWIETKDLDQLNKAWEITVAEKKEFNAIYRFKTPNNKLFYVRERGYPIFDENGNLFKMKGTIQDVTNAELAKKKLEKTSAQIEKQNNNLISSINYAQRIQSAMLGGTQDLKQIFKDAFVFFQPKDVVSGDFYWYNEIGTRKIAILADCTGHGVPGAFMSLLGTSLLNEVVLQRQITTPSKILDFMQSEIRRILKQDTTGNRDGMDMAIVVVDTSIGMMEFAGAKNPLVYINKKRKKGGAEANITLIKGDVHPIGGRSKRNMDTLYTNHAIELENIEAFYIYSDGYQDQFGGEEGRKFMSNKFRQLLYDTHSTSMRHQRVALKRSLMNWMGTENDQIDDICVMGITI